MSAKIILFAFASAVLAGNAVSSPDILKQRPSGSYCDWIKKTATPTNDEIAITEKLAGNVLKKKPDDWGALYCMSSVSIARKDWKGLVKYGHRLEEIAETEKELVFAYNAQFIAYQNLGNDNEARIYTAKSAPLEKKIMDALMKK